MMTSLSKLLLLTVATLLLTFTGIGQETPSNDAKASETPMPIAEGAKDGRQGMLQQIGLTREQFRQLRQFNARHRPIIMAAQQKLREATASLDEAIYADILAEGEFETKLKAQQLAQAEVIRLRSMGELAIRKILTPEQLVKFRELRKQFEDMRRENVQRRQKDVEPKTERRFINRQDNIPNQRPVKN